MSAEPGLPTLDPTSNGSLPVPDEIRWRTHILLFALTALCVLVQGAIFSLSEESRLLFRDLVNPRFLARGASFAVPLLAILTTHEFGHFFAARFHRVPASLPYFLPAPGIGPGTLGAIIAMRGPIRSRNALLDIGASGPIAGLVVALPVLAWGLVHSEIVANPTDKMLLQEGQSLLYVALKALVIGPIPDGHDVLLHPTALAGWFGLFLTMVNLLPWGQLDGGHIAFALVGERHHVVARWLRRSLLLLFAFNVVRLVVPVLRGTSKADLTSAIFLSASWLVLFLVLGLLARVSGGAEHPPYEPGELSRGRKILGWVCIALFVLLFMPTPMGVS